MDTHGGDLRPHPQEVVRIPVHGYEVATYSFGNGEEVLFCLHGGPGLSCDYIRDTHSWLADGRYRVVTYDQLGCGASDRPDDERLWNIDRYVDEVEIVRNALNLGKVHLLGQSWGAMLGIEYSLTHPNAIKTLIIVDGAASIPHLTEQLDMLRDALDSETAAMMRHCEAEGRFDHPDYQAAIELLTHRHICRLETVPEPLLRSVRNVNAAVFNAIQGPNDFVFTGNLKGWDRLGQLHRLSQPTLLLCGQHDLLTPACSRLMQQMFPNSRMVVFPNSSHSPFLEEPEAYFTILQSFLDEHAFCGDPLRQDIQVRDGPV
ncbi:proline iminopeptidase-family hydrolase [Mesorhizobium sp.]|uniref:proline iminopeptidase-family hydrolase n=1 Tax=Mesorhizobium sp. TaxID=1871066 RepID=UPI000FEA543B|nr:proline iminopeptidase-family hydrolase [Mesorhizobium sp.]RWE72263.1 MAG: alpha/beta fold hydrolase [Mesorhizobium sp.]TIV29920.1 MAG: alpha/beta fold hydrolase [Mesorhizobium sp.]